MPLCARSGESTSPRWFYGSSQPGARKWVILKLQRELHALKGKSVPLLGLSFKPNTDDLKEAPSLTIVRALDSLGARAVGYDPVASKVASGLPLLLKVAFDPYKALTEAHAGVMVTEWEEIRQLHLNLAAAFVEEPKVLVDGHNALDPQDTLHGLRAWLRPRPGRGGDAGGGEVGLQLAATSASGC